MNTRDLIPLVKYSMNCPIRFNGKQIIRSVHVISERFIMCRNQRTIRWFSGITDDDEKVRIMSVDLRSWYMYVGDEIPHSWRIEASYNYQEE